MSPRPVRLGGLVTVVLLVLGLLAPAAVAAPRASADVLGARGSAFAPDRGVRAASTDPIAVRDLSDACPTGRVPASGFLDVPGGSTFARAIDCLVWYRVTQGTSATTYAPNAAVTRRQMAVFLHRLLDDLVVLPDPPPTSAFRDVPASGEAGEAINVLASADLADLLGVQVVAGRTATTFDPGGRVSRAQMGSFINRVLEGVASYYGASIERGNCGIPARPDEGCFPDEARIPPTHRANVAALFRMGIVAGRADGTYGPAADVTRGQMAAFLTRLLDVFVEAEVAIPPDRYTDVYVDAGTVAAPCTPSGRDGSLTRPFCTIQAGVDRARTLDGYVVTVVVLHRAGAPAYAGPVVLSSGEAFSVDLIGEPEADDYVPLTGTIRIDGASTREANAVVGFDLTPVGDAPAIDVRTNGAAFVFFNVLSGGRGMVVDQGGATAVAFNVVDVALVGVDLVRTSLAATDVAANLFLTPTDVYVRAPENAENPNVRLAAWQDANDFLNQDGSTATVRIGTSGGRAALLP
jgi:hypothetical protein